MAYNKLCVDQYLDREYDLEQLNCGHFVAKVWKDLSGADILHICTAFMDSDMELLKEYRRELKPLRLPETPCIALMQAPNVEPHAGIYLNAKILHLTTEGAKFENLALLKAYWRISYYK